MECLLTTSQMARIVTEEPVDPYFSREEQRVDLPCDLNEDQFATTFTDVLATAHNVTLTFCGENHLGNIGPLIPGGNMFYDQPQVTFEGQTPETVLDLSGGYGVEGNPGFHVTTDATSNPTFNFRNLTLTTDGPQAIRADGSATFNLKTITFPPELDVNTLFDLSEGGTLTVDDVTVEAGANIANIFSLSEGSTCSGDNFRIGDVGDDSEYFILGSSLASSGEPTTASTLDLDGFTIANPLGLSLINQKTMTQKIEIYEPGTYTLSCDTETTSCVPEGVDDWEWEK